MAIVVLTNEVKDSILTKVRQTYTADLGKNKIDYNKLLKPGVADDFYSWLVPNESELKKHLPQWAQGSHSQLHVCVNDENATSRHINMMIDYSSSHIILAGGGYGPSIEGTTGVYFDGRLLQFNLVDVDKLPPGLAKDFIADVLKAGEAERKLKAEADEACALMRKFLDQHRTVQQAMNTMGPAMNVYLDPWLTEEVKRVVPSRARTKKAPKETEPPVNVNKLIARATASKLNL